MNVKKTFFNWSSGKDSALSLYRLIKNPSYSVEHLVTSINKPLQRVTMHGLNVSLLKKQLSALNLPYSFIELPENPSHDEYTKIMTKKILKLKKDGYTHAAFGDIYLEDLRKHREEQLNKHKMNTVFPIWNEKPSDLIAEFFSLGFKAIVVCVDGQKLDSSFVGRAFDSSFLSDLPKGIDLCGENGEFHTFCYDGPIFLKAINFNIADKVERTYTTKDKDFIFHFCELKG